MSGGAPEPPYEVCQAGPRRLFDEVEAAYLRWVDAGKPQLRDWVITVGPAGQTIALDPARTAAAAEQR